MNQFIESFFDDSVEEQKGFKLWNKTSEDIKIEPKDVIIEGLMHKINRKSNKTKERYFVLTKSNFYYMKSEKNKKIRGEMCNDFVRVEYLEETH